MSDDLIITYNSLQALDVSHRLSDPGLQPSGHGKQAAPLQKCKPETRDTMVFGKVQASHVHPTSLAPPGRANLTRSMKQTKRALRLSLRSSFREGACVAGLHPDHMFQGFRQTQQIRQTVPTRCAEVFCCKAILVQIVLRLLDLFLPLLALGSPLRPPEPSTRLVGRLPEAPLFEGGDGVLVKKKKEKRGTDWERRWVMD